MTFISKVKQGAINGWHTHQILPSISIAQAILESASGTSSLGAKYNNLFGIKASADWTGKVINLPTREHGANGSYQTNANFRWYDSWSDSMIDHAAFFTNTPWRVENYKHVVGEADYKKAAQALQSAGYATDPQYAAKLIQRIEQNNLTQYDTEAFNGEPSNVGVIKKVVGGTLTELAKSAVKQYDVTLIGDSLGVGTQPKLNGVFKSFTHDVLGSRQITHATNSLNGTHVLQSLRDYGQLKNIIVVVLGTNRGVTDTEIDNFVAIAGNRKVIFVDTNSQVAHRQSVSDAYRRASERHNNAYHASWMAYSNSLRSRYYGSDNIHMTNEGYQAHADFIKMAVYEAGVGVRTALGTIGTLTEYIGIEDIDYKEGDLISPKGESIIYNHPANELWGNKMGDHVIWIESILEVDSDDPQFILDSAVKVMKENSQPAAQYAVDLSELPDDVSIGDWGYMIDHEFNPPLYIHARVLEIITSETDLNANKAIIGNVTEVFPADKTDIKLIQADLKDARDNLVREYRKGQPILVLLNSTNGSTLGDKYTETELVAKVTQGSEDLTNQFITYTWERVSNDAASDDIYNEIISTETTNRLIITSKDIVNNLSTFVVRVYDDDVLINQSSITVKHVDTALWTDTNTAPSDAKDGATWVDENGKHWILKDGEWEERVDQAQLFNVRGEVEGAIAEAEQAKEAAEQAYQDAIEEAERLVTEQDTVWQGKMEDYDEQVLAIEGAVQSAQDKAEQALTDVGISTDLAQTAKDLADTAKTNAQTALNNASTAISDASEALTASQNAESQAGTAMSDASQAIASANTAKTNAQTALDDAQSALTTAGSADNKAGQAIAKANAIPTTITDIITDKNLVNGSYVDTKVDDATGAWSQELVRVEGVIDGLEIGGRNYFSYNYVFDNLTDTLWSNGNMQGVALELLPNTEYLLTSNCYGDGLSSIFIMLPFQEPSSPNNGIGINSPIRSVTTGEDGVLSIGVRRIGSNEIVPSKDDFINGTYWAKLEKGNKATDWTPAPEDLYSQEEFKLFNAQYTQDVTGMTGRLTTVESNKLDGSTFQTFKQAEYQVTADKVASTISRVDTAEGKITTQGTAISQQATAIASKADKTVVDTLSGTVTNQGTLITQNATDIASKASSSSVNTLTGRVSTAETSISQNATAITSKASQTEVDTVKGTVSNHTSTLSQHATQISARLTSSQVNSLVDGKGLAKVTYVDNQITATADGIRTDMTRVEGKIDGLEVGGRNYFSYNYLFDNLTGNLWSNNNIKGVTLELLPNTKYLLTSNCYIDTTSSIFVMLPSREPSSANNGIQINSPIRVIITGEDGIVHIGVRTSGGGVIPSKDDFINGTYWAKLEKGNVATDWSPAPEDTMMESDFNIFKASYEATSENLSSRLTAVDKAGGRLATAETKITQNATAISSKANTSTVNTLTGRVSTAETNISQNATAISARLTESQVNTLVSGKGYATQTWSNQTFATPQSVTTQLKSYAKTTALNGMVTETTLATKNFVTAGTMSTTLSNYAQKNGVPTNTQFNTLKNSYDSMVQTIGTNGSKIAQMVMTDSLFSTTVRNSVEIGGRNLLKDSGKTVSNGSYNIARYDLTDVIKQGEEVTLTIWGSLATTKTNFRAYNSGGSVSVTTLKDNGDGTYSSTFKWNIGSSTNTYLNVYAFTNSQTGTSTINKIKLEKGNISTDWTPAPEDKADQSQVTQLAGSWALTLKSGNDIKTQINASTSSLRLASKFIHLSGTSLIDNATIKSAHIDTLNANKITGNTAEFNTIRAGVLTANAVTSTHINANTALFDKLFSTDSATMRLVAQGAWITNGNIISLNADKITAGTISADRISTSSLDNVVIGGRNLLKNTGDLSDANTLPPTHTTDGNYFTTGSRLRVGRTDKNSNIVFKLSRKIEYGEKITISMKIYAWSSVTSIARFIIGYSNGSLWTKPVAAGQLNDVKITITAGNGVAEANYTPNDELWMAVQYPFEIEPGTLMVEAGNLTSNWTPAPEDIVDDLGSSGRVEIHGGNIKADTLDVGAITGNTATFISGGVKGLNSNMALDGGGMTIQDSAGNTASISSTPDFKAIGSDGTAVYMTKGNIDFAADGAQKFKIGTKVRGSQNGIVINKNHGWALMRESGTFGGSPAQYHKVGSRALAKGASATIKRSAQYVWTDSNQRLYMTTNNVKGRTHTVETVGTGTFAGKYKLRHPESAWGITGWVQASDIVETTDTWRQITTQYYNSSTPITTVLSLNGSSLPASTPIADLPELTVGMDVLVKNAVAGNTSGVGSVFEIWSEGTNNIIQFDYIVRHLYDLVKVSDRRLKHDIIDSSIHALDHINSLTFKDYKWNRDGSREPIGLIAQDSGIIRMEGETEGINTTRAVMLGLKGVQELQRIVAAQADEIKQLKEIINQ